jgi:hypothetical protein
MCELVDLENNPNAPYSFLPAYLPNCSVSPCLRASVSLCLCVSVSLCLCVSVLNNYGPNAAEWPFRKAVIFTSRIDVDP